MKAVLNKDYDQFIKIMNYLWSRRNVLGDDFYGELDKYKRDVKFQINPCLREAIQTAFYRMKSEWFKTKDKFINDIYDDKGVNFSKLFIKRIIK